MEELTGRVAVVTGGASGIGLVEAGKPPDELAEQVLDAIRAGRFLVLTEPEISKGAVDSRAAALEGSDPTLPLLG